MVNVGGLLRGGVRSFWAKESVSTCGLTTDSNPIERRSPLRKVIFRPVIGP